MDNPNEYNDEDFTQASMEYNGYFEEGIGALWAAGATLGDIESEIATALDSALDSSFRVKITVEGD